MHRIGITTAILLCAATAAAEVAPEAPPPQPPPSATTARILHLPLNEVEEGDVRFAFEVDAPDRMGMIAVIALPDGNAGKRVETIAKRAHGGYEAVLTATQLPPPGFRYYVVERLADGQVRPVFADAREPHHVRVTRPPDVETELEHLAERGGQRSTVIASGELVDFGDRQLATGAAPTHDRYYRLEAGYAYSFLSKVEDVRLTLVRVRGEAGDLVLPAATTGTASPKRVSVTTNPGIDYGRAQITVFDIDGIRLRGAVLLGASQRGFEYGGGGSVIIGHPRSFSLDAGVEAMTTLGVTTHLRLGFQAAPKIPMGATIEVTNFPLGSDLGVRLLYDVGYRFGKVTTLTLRGGYQGRTSISGGPALGLVYELGF